MADSSHIPPPNAHIHLMGICGVGMSSLAGILKQKGYRITGSDHNIYPPISTFLETLSIPIKKGYNPSNLHARPDLVIVGNVITRDNPEARELLRIGIPYLSMPQGLREFAIGKRKSIAIAGTHGKTTTCALTAWILELAGVSPSFMIGGIARNFDSNFRLAPGPYFVVEGDEYDTAFFDKRPKFLHYNPSVAAITSIEFDHADIYTGIDQIRASFRTLIEMIPAGGVLCANLDDVVVADEIKRARCRCVTYATKRQADLTVRDIAWDDDKTMLTVVKGKDAFLTATTSLYGTYNMYNILAAIAITAHLGIEPQVIAKAIASFKGVSRRLELIGGYDDIVVIDDFAHHPTSVRQTTKAVKCRYKDRRLVAVFEPRSNSSRRNIFQDAYASSFDCADLVMVPEPPMMEKIPANERFSSLRLTTDLRERGIEAHYFANNNDLLEGLLTSIRPGDVILIMSNGAFDHVQGRLLERIKERSLG
jgi:UDP-N-acetylmuramate: L-alanyl-gamma-D-glutamyl-meso-diaminopimelate ligase